MVDKIE